jgi:hypothetical protein
MSVADTGRALVEQAKRLPWWAWVLIVVAIFLAVRFLGSGASSGDALGDPSSGGTSGGGSTIPPNYPPGQQPGGDSEGGTGTPPPPGGGSKPGKEPDNKPSKRERDNKPASRRPAPAPSVTGTHYDKRYNAVQQRLQRLDASGSGPDTVSENSAYTVRPGDTLASIADAHGIDHETLYDRNRGVIEASARSSGLLHSDGGFWLRPGTRLEIR